jgi:hypothetical protein
VGFVRSSLSCLLAAAAVAVSGCATQTVSLQEGPREYVATDYENVLRSWTRTEHLIALAELENFLTATATFESWDFRWKYNDLTKADSAWIVRLIDDTGNETAPEDIQEIIRPNALERTYYPYNTVWRLAFRIRFPRVLPDGRPTISPSAKWFGLRFAGAQGNSELIWNVESAEDAQEKPGDPAPPTKAPPPLDDTLVTVD